MEDMKDTNSVSLPSLVPRAPQDYLDILSPFCSQQQALLFYEDEMRLSAMLET